MDQIFLIENYLLYIQYFKQILLAASLGFFLFICHGFFVNAYLKNQNFLLISIILPITALTIVKAIMTNAWLSIGLIGALSIVRFRTPVKSNYELALIFGLITIGVVGGVDKISAIIFGLTISLIAPIYKFFNKYFPQLIKFLISKEEFQKYEIILRVEGSLNDSLSQQIDKSYLTSSEEIFEKNKTKTIAVFTYPDKEIMNSQKKELNKIKSKKIININSLS